MTEIQHSKFGRADFLYAWGWRISKVKKESKRIYRASDKGNPDMVYRKLKQVCLR